MIEHGIWEVLKATLQWVAAPLAALLAYIGKKYIARIEMVEKEIHELKTRQAVVEEQVKDIREDIKHLVTVVREVEKTILEEIKNNLR